MLATGLVLLVVFSTPPAPAPAPEAAPAAAPPPEPAPTVAPTIHATLRPFFQVANFLAVQNQKHKRHGPRIPNPWLDACSFCSGSILEDAVDGHCRFVGIKFGGRKEPVQLFQALSRTHGNRPIYATNHTKGRNMKVFFLNNSNHWVIADKIGSKYVYAYTQSNATKPDLIRGIWFQYQPEAKRFHAAPRAQMQCYQRPQLVCSQFDVVSLDIQPRKLSGVYAFDPSRTRYVWDSVETELILHRQEDSGHLRNEWAVVNKGDSDGAPILQVNSYSTVPDKITEQWKAPLTQTPGIGRSAALSIVCTGPKVIALKPLQATLAPTPVPSASPTPSPTSSPTAAPSPSPTSGAPTTYPSQYPTASPTHGRVKVLQIVVCLPGKAAGTFTAKMQATFLEVFIGTIGADAASMHIERMNTTSEGLQWELESSAPMPLNKLMLRYLVMRVRSKTAIRTGSDINTALRFLSRINKQLQRKGQTQLSRIHIRQAAIATVIDTDRKRWECIDPPCPSVDWSQPTPAPPTTSPTASPTRAPTIPLPTPCPPTVPPPCQAGEWLPFLPCSKTCGFGVQQRHKCGEKGQEVKICHMGKC